MYFVLIFCGLSSANRVFLWYNRIMIRAADKPETAERKKNMKTYKIRFDTSTEKDAIEYIDAYTAQEARDKLSEKHPDIFNVEIIARLG